MPFGGGQRRCIGAQFATRKAQIIVPMVTREFGVELLPGRQVVPEPGLTLRVRGGLSVALHPRRGKG
ncbi:MAG: cytochrome P450 [Planctomycetia bacterium]|nr:cytochrome P450 [Planctomycetia bacterium]